ncbi:hypothetical protein XENTR_v10017899 [Xenopus tropicalis]|nr:hypothetical protein XENTR_v10017899 [Xenopus tropicalis]
MCWARVFLLNLTKSYIKSDGHPCQHQLQPALQIKYQSLRIGNIGWNSLHRKVLHVIIGMEIRHYQNEGKLGNPLKMLAQEMPPFQTVGRSLMFLQNYLF